MKRHYLIHGISSLLDSPPKSHKSLKSAWAIIIKPLLGVIRERGGSVRGSALPASFNVLPRFLLPAFWLLPLALFCAQIPGSREQRAKMWRVQGARTLLTEPQTTSAGFCKMDIKITLICGWYLVTHFLIYILNALCWHRFIISIVLAVAKKLRQFL